MINAIADDNVYHPNNNNNNNLIYKALSGHNFRGAQY